MRFEGVLTQWHVDRGYGVITPMQGGLAVFVHISAFPANGAQPAAQELLSFEIVSGSKGEKQAAHVQRLKAAPAEGAPAWLPAGSAAARRVPAKPQRRALSFVLLSLVLAVGLLSWLEMSQADGRHVAQLVAAGTTVR